MSENYYALIISILKGLTPEQSFELLNTGRIKEKYDPEDVKDMIKLKAMGMTYKELAEAFNISVDCAYHRISRFNRRSQLCSAVYI